MLVWDRRRRDLGGEKEGDEQYSGSKIVLHVVYFWFLRVFFLSYFYLRSMFFFVFYVTNIFFRVLVLLLGIYLRFVTTSAVLYFVSVSWSVCAPGSKCGPATATWTA